MPQLVFDTHNVQPHFQQVCSIAVAQGVSANLLLDTGLLDAGAESMSNPFATGLLPAHLSVEKPVLRVRGFQVLLYAFYGDRGNRHVTVFFVLALAHVHLFAVKINIRDFQGNYF